MEKPLNHLHGVKAYLRELILGTCLCSTGRRRLLCVQEKRLSKDTPLQVRHHTVDLTPLHIISEVKKKN